MSMGPSFVGVESQTHSWRRRSGAVQDGDEIKVKVTVISGASLPHRLSTGFQCVRQLRFQNRSPPKCMGSSGFETGSFCQGDLAGPVFETGATERAVCLQAGHAKPRLS